MGLGTVTESGVVFLGIAGGYVWDKKADKNHGAYAEQKFTNMDGSDGLRTGARYADITGKVVEIKFSTHAQYGESINLTIDAGDDRYIVAVKTSNRYSQDIMKALLMVDIESIIRIKPYAFPDKVTQKLVQGCNIFQGAEKVELKDLEVMKPQGCKTEDDVKNFFKTADKKKVIRYFDDLSDWLKAEILETVVPSMKPLERKEGKPAVHKPAPVEEETTDSEETGVEENSQVSEEATSTKVVLTPLKMKQALRAYSAENYEGREIPKTLAGAELVKWYELSVEGEDLPWIEDEGSDVSEVAPTDISSQLDALRG